MTLSGIIAILLHGCIIGCPVTYQQDQPNLNVPADLTTHKWKLPKVQTPDNGEPQPVPNNLPKVQRPTDQGNFWK